MRENWSRRRAVAGLAVALTIAAQAGATTVVGKSFRSLATEAEEIFAATVTDVESYQKDGGRIWTAVRFGDLTWIAGGERPQVELHFAGGRIGERAEVVGGMPRFSEGQRVLLFVRDAGTASPIVGFHQGCFALETADGEDVVVTANRRPVLSLEGGRLRTGEPGVIEGAMSFEDFRRAVNRIRRDARQ